MVVGDELLSVPRHRSPEVEVTAGAAAGRRGGGRDSERSGPHLQHGASRDQLTCDHQFDSFHTDRDPVSGDKCL